MSDYSAQASGHCEKRSNNANQSRRPRQTLRNKLHFYTGSKQNELAVPLRRFPCIPSKRARKFALIPLFYSALQLSCCSEIFSERRFTLCVNIFRFILLEIDRTILKNFLHFCLYYETEQTYFSSFVSLYVSTKNVRWQRKY